MEQSEQKSSNRGLLFGLIGAGVLIVALAVVGIVVFAGGVAQQRQSSIPELLGADTAIYGTITPALGDLPNIARLQAAYPALFVEQDPTAANEQLEELLGVTFEADIQPWIGAEVAFALNDLETLMAQDDAINQNGAGELPPDANIAIIAASTSAESAQAFLDKQRTYRSEQGETFNENSHGGVTIFESASVPETLPPFMAAFALVGDYVVFASVPEMIMTMIDNNQSDEGATLASNPRFVQLRDTMPDAIGYIYLDGNSLSEALLANMQEGLQQMSPEQATQIEEQAENLRALQSIGLSVSILAEGIQFESTTIFDVAQFTEEVTSQLDAYREPVDEARLQNISTDSLALMTFKIPSTFGEQIMKTIEAQPDGEASLQEMEQQFNINLEEDILSWLAGDASLVVLPPEDITGITMPSLYFSLQPQDIDAAQAGVEKIVSVLQLMGMGMATFAEQEIGGQTWQVVNEAQTNNTLGGYAFVDDNLVIAVSPGAMEQASTGSEQPVTNSDSFNTVMSKLYASNGGVFYTDVAQVLSAMEEAGATETMDPETLDALEPIQAFGAAAEPGLDESGVARSRAFVLLRNPE